MQKVINVLQFSTAPDNSYDGCKSQVHQCSQWIANGSYVADVYVCTFLTQDGRYGYAFVCAELFSCITLIQLFKTETVTSILHYLNLSALAWNPVCKCLNCYSYWVVIVQCCLSVKAVAIWRKQNDEGHSGWMWLIRCINTDYFRSQQCYCRTTSCTNQHKSTIMIIQNVTYWASSCIWFMHFMRNSCASNCEPRTYFSRKPAPHKRAVVTNGNDNGRTTTTVHSRITTYRCWRCWQCKCNVRKIRTATVAQIRVQFSSWSGERHGNTATEAVCNAPENNNTDLAGIFWTKC